MVREWPDTRHVYYGTAAERAAFPAAGEAAGALFFDYDDETWYYWDGAAWQMLAIGGGGAPANAQYLALALNGTLTAERRFVPNTPLVATDGGANADYDLDLPISALVEEATPAANDWLLMEINAGGTFNKVQVGNVGAAGWPFTVITVDPTDTDADYSSLDTAIATEGTGDYAIGPGSHNLTAVGGAIPAGSVVGMSPVDSTAVNGYNTGGDISVPFLAAATINVQRVNFNAVSLAAVTTMAAKIGDSADVDARYCSFISISISGDAYGIYAGDSVTLRAYGGRIVASGGGTLYGIRVGTGSTAYLYNIPTIEADTFFVGAGTVTGVFQDVNGALYEIDGAPGTEVLIRPAGVDPTGHTHSKIVASDGAPDPAWSVDAAGNLAAAGAYSLDVNAGEVILDADGDTGFTADTDDQIDVKINNADTFVMTPTAFKGTGSLSPTLGTTTLAEKLGHIYLALAKDIYPDNDVYGLWDRMVNFGIASPDEHWHQNADMLAWTGWAAYTGYVTPGTITHTNSQKRVRYSGGAGKAFYYRAAATAADIVLRQAVSLLPTAAGTAHAGVMIDDGADDGDGEGAGNFYRVMVESTGGTTNWNIRREYRTGGGAPVAAVTAFSLQPGDFYCPVLFAHANVAGNWGNWWVGMYYRRTNAGEQLVQFDNPPFTWTPARVGLYYYVSAASVAYGIWDLYDEATS